MPPAMAGTQKSQPTHWLNSGRAGLDAQELQERRPHDEGQHQELVDVEGEAEGGDAADEPLGGGERGGLAWEAACAIGRDPTPPARVREANTCQCRSRPCPRPWTISRPWSGQDAQLNRRSAIAAPLGETLVRRWAGRSNTGSRSPDRQLREASKPRTRSSRSSPPRSRWRSSRRTGRPSTAHREGLRVQLPQKSARRAESGRLRESRSNLAHGLRLTASPFQSLQPVGSRLGESPGRTGQGCEVAHHAIPAQPDPELTSRTAAAAPPAGASDSRWARPDAAPLESSAPRQVRVAYAKGLAWSLEESTSSRSGVAAEGRSSRRVGGPMTTAPP